MVNTHLSAMKRILFFCITAIQSVGAFAQDFTPTSNGEIVKHSFYALSYIERHEQAEWVYYQLTPSMINGSVSRMDDFRPDPEVSTRSAQVSDYKGSGYDRGHLAPAADMKHSLTAMSESFFLSNMSPQEASFNRGIWKKLESQVRTWTREKNSLYVVTGPILSSNKGSIGSNNVTIPAYYYKVLLDYEGQDKGSIALILPHEKGTKKLSEYVVPIDSVETITGIDFFPDFTPDEEVEFEWTKNTTWTFSSTSNYSTNSSSNSSAAQQCNGIAKSNGVRCKSKTTNDNGFCHNHQSRASTEQMSTDLQKSNGPSQCKGITKSTGVRCKLNTNNENGYCYAHKSQSTD